MEPYCDLRLGKVIEDADGRRAVVAQNHVALGLGGGHRQGVAGLVGEATCFRSPPDQHGERPPRSPDDVLPHVFARRFFDVDDDTIGDEVRRDQYIDGGQGAHRRRHHRRTQVCQGNRSGCGISIHDTASDAPISARDGQGDRIGDVDIICEGQPSVTVVVDAVARGVTLGFDQVGRWQSDLQPIRIRGL